MHFKKCRHQTCQTVSCCNIKARLVYIYSPGGVYPYMLCSERDAFWVYPYPVDDSQWNMYTDLVT